MQEDKITLRGVSITNDSLKKYGVEFNETEWKIFSTYMQKSWNNDEDGLRKLVFFHLRSAMSTMGYKPSLSGNDIVFLKSED